MSYDPAVENRVRALDLDEARASYRAQDELAIFDSFLSDQVLADLLDGLERVQPDVMRKKVPGYKSSGSVGLHTLREKAPAFVELYRSRALIGFLSELVGEQLLLCPDRDVHACALYQYTEPGDRVGWHYDTSHYRGARYTVLIGLVNDCSSRLHCRLFTHLPERDNEERFISLDRGKMLVFNGDRLYHSVTPLGDNEKRVILTMQYVTDQHMSVPRRLISDLKDAMTYFGFKNVLRPARTARSA